MITVSECLESLSQCGSDVVRGFARSLSIAVCFLRAVCRSDGISAFSRIETRLRHVGHRFWMHSICCQNNCLLALAG